MTNKLEVAEKLVEKLQKEGPSFDINHLPNNREELKSIIQWQNHLKKLMN
jgi:hypothetical protein